MSSQEKNGSVNVEEDVDCSPGMLGSRGAILRWLHMAIYFTLHWLIDVTCGNDACTMIMNVFGYIAMGQVFVLIILLLLSILCAIILVLYGLNAHRSRLRNAVLGLERVYAILGVLLMIIAGALGTWMAVQTTDELVNRQGRGYGGIRGQWIAAAVIEFLTALLFAFDLFLQKREGFPTFEKNPPVVRSTALVNNDFETYKPAPAYTQSAEAYNPTVYNPAPPQNNFNSQFTYNQQPYNQFAPQYDQPPKAAFSQSMF